MSYNSPFTGTVIQPTDVSFRAITLSANTQLQWPINGNATDDYAARIMNVTATTSNLSLYMPPANQTSVGNDALIRNTGSNTFTVKTYDNAGTIISVAAGEAKYIYITTNPDEAGTWGVISFGVGSSNADAATLAGYGLLASGVTLNQSHPVTTFSTNATANATYRAQTYVWTGGAGTLTLDTVGNLGNNWFVMLRNAGTGALTVAAQGGTLINGSSSIIMQPTDSCIVVCSGTAFYTVGLGKSTLFNFTQLTKDVSAGGTFTLTTTEASNVIQKYTGTLAGNATVIVPPTVQVYYIINEAAGGVSNYDVTISTGVGNDVTLTQGQSAIVICDSVNLINAVTVSIGVSSISLPDGTVAAPPLNFASEVSTGIYRAASGEINMAILGANEFTLTSTGLTIGGGVSATTGTFSGAVSGTTGTFSGAVAGTTGTFSSTVSGTAGTFSGAVSGTTGTFSSAVSGTTGTFTGAVSGTTGTFTSGISGGVFT